MKWLVVFAGLVSMALAYKSGPPLGSYPDICGTMTPNHTTTNAGRTDASPFEIVLDGSCYKKDVVIGVSLRSKADNSTYYFEGLLVQVRKSGDATKSYGTFGTKSDANLQLFDCLGGTQNTIGHKNGAHFFNKNFTWTGPADSGDLEFVATVVHETEDFWLDLKSSKITYSATCAGTSGATFLTASALLLTLLSFAWLL